MIRKKIVQILAVFLIFFLFSIDKTYAASPSLYFYPSSGIISNVKDGFTLDVLINSGGYDITQARFTITFDPKVIQVTKASRNNTLFDEFPDDESSIDNTNGVIMLTGFTQSGGSFDLYNNDKADVLARLEFDIVSSKKEDIILDWEYSGEDDMYKTFLMKNGSPPQNVLSSKPERAKFTYSGSSVPSTAIEPTYIGIFFGIVLIAVGVFITNTKAPIFRKKKGTVVLYE